MFGRQHKSHKERADTGVSVCVVTTHLAPVVPSASVPTLPSCVTGKREHREPPTTHTGSGSTLELAANLSEVSQGPEKASSRIWFYQKF